MVRKANRYVQIIEAIFFKHYREDATEVPFERSDIVKSARELGIKLPKNLGDVLSGRRGTLLGFEVDGEGIEVIRVADAKEISNRRCWGIAPCHGQGH
jgi:hypothetical protein